MSAEPIGRDVARHLTETEITDYWGDRCDAFEPSCCACLAWARHDIIAAMAAEDERTRAEILLAVRSPQVEGAE